MMKFRLFIKLMVCCEVAFFVSIEIFSKATAFPLSWIGKREELTPLPPPPEPDLLDKIFENPILMLLIAVIFLLIVLVAITIVKNRKKKRPRLYGDTIRRNDCTENRRKWKF